jgi:hypothetical protein
VFYWRCADLAWALETSDVYEAEAAHERHLNSQSVDSFVRELTARLAPLLLHPSELEDLIQRYRLLTRFATDSLHDLQWLLTVALDASSPSAPVPLAIPPPTPSSDSFASPNATSSLASLGAAAAAASERTHSAVVMAAAAAAVVGGGGGGGGGGHHALDGMHLLVKAFLKESMKQLPVSSLQSILHTVRQSSLPLKDQVRKEIEVKFAEMKLARVSAFAPNQFWSSAFAAVHTITIPPDHISAGCSAEALVAVCVDRKIRCFSKKWGSHPPHTLPTRFCAHSRFAVSVI